MKKTMVLGLLMLGVSSAAAFAGVAEDRLAEAVRNHDHAAVQKLLAAHANPNARLPDKSTALIWAADRQDAETVAMLVKAGAKPNVADMQGATPLTVACELGNPDIVVSLLKAGANAKSARPDGISALALCAGMSAPAALDAMVAKGADVNAADPDGETPLMWAAAKGNADNVAFLVAHGANVNAVANKGFTPLFFAIRSKDTRSPPILLDAGADVKAVLPADGTTVAEAAVLENNSPFARLVAEKGVDLAAHDKQGRQLIHVAAASGTPELVTYLLSKGVDANVMSSPPPNPVFRRGPPPAAAAGGAPANAVGGAVGGGPKKGLAIADGAIKAPPVALYATPPLLFAAKAGSVDVMKALVAGGAKPDARASDGMNITMAAAYGGNLAALKYALEIDPDVNVTDASGKGLMHMAVINPQSQEPQAVIQYLADKGAPLNAKDKRGRTPADTVDESVREFYNAMLKQRGIELDRLGPADAGKAAANAVN